MCGQKKMPPALTEGDSYSYLPVRISIHTYFFPDW